MSEEEVLLERIYNVVGGSAVCFLGAGFSNGATDSKGKKVPSSQDLTAEIRELTQIEGEEDASLSDLAEYCEADRNLKEKLNQLLIERLTLCKATDIHKKILALPWRCVFTTNFDDVVERSLQPKDFVAITRNSGLSALRPGFMPIYYLHGRALDVLEGAVEPGTVISETNYLRLREHNRDLFATLENEVHTASTVFFFGYSLRDMEIASTLFNIPNLSEKSVLITRSGEGALAQNRLRKFGRVYKIGIEGFVEQLPSENDIEEQRKQLSFIQFLNAKAAFPAKLQVERQDVERLILSGKFEYAAYAKQEVGEDRENLYCVKRERKLNEMFEPVNKTYNRYFVTSDLGNGKSTFF